MVKSATVIIIAALAVGASLPSGIQGRWIIGKPYDVGQPIGLDQRQEDGLVGRVVAVSSSRIRVCGRQIAISSVAFEQLTAADFLARYNFTPSRLGFERGLIQDVRINASANPKACGPFAAPGTHLLVGADHAVAEVGNDYFRLQRSR